MLQIGINFSVLATGCNKKTHYVIFSLTPNPYDFVLLGYSPMNYYLCIQLPFHNHRSFDCPSEKCASGDIRAAADMFAKQVQSSHLVLSHHSAVDRSVSRDVHVSQIGKASKFFYSFSVTSVGRA